MYNMNMNIQKGAISHNFTRNVLCWLNCPQFSHEGKFDTIQSGI